MSHKDRRKIRGVLLNCILIMSMVVELLSTGLGASRANAAEVAAQPVSWNFPGLSAQDELKDLMNLSKLAEKSVLLDISGHWAEAKIQEWADQGLVAGFEDGTFRPDQDMSRIEYIALINRLFSFSGTGDNRFSDVLPTAWYASQVQAALKVGYIQGFSDGTFRPEQRISRVDAAVILSRLVPVITNEEFNRLGGFIDQASVPQYGRNQLEAIIEAGYMSGFANGMIKPLQSLTRAEAVVILDRVLKRSVRFADGITLKSNVLETGGTWGPAQGSFIVAGDLTIQAPSTTLRNVTIKGNLTIDKAVGDGDVFLRGVTVLGNTYVNGGGENSIHIDDSNLSTVVIERVDGRVRVVVGGTTVVEQLDIESEASIESNGTSGSKIEGITITSTGEVMLSGKFNRVEIMGDVALTVSSGTIEQLQVNEGSVASSITLNSGVMVTNAQLFGATSVKGEGIITNARVDADHVEFETQPTNVEVTERGGTTGGGAGGNGGSSVPTNPGTNPPVDSTVTVSVTVSQSKANSVRVVLNPAVPGLSAAGFTLRNAAGEPIAVTNTGTLDSGTTYVLSTTLIEGQSYSITATKSGYSFGSAVTFTVPITPPEDITVSATVYGDAQTAGLMIKLNGAVTGLAVTDFTLKRNEDIVVINGVSSTDGGYTYAIDAPLAEGASYTLTIAKMGYNFGGVLTFAVSESGVISVTTSVYGAVSTAGITVKLVGSVEGLIAGNFMLSHNGNTVAISGVSNSDGGETYAISATLIQGQTYTLTIAQAGYNFSELVFTVPDNTVPSVTMVAPSVSQLSSSGFILSMDRPVEDLEIASFEITDSSQNAVGINMLEAVSTDTVFEVYTSFSLGETYTVMLNKDGYVFTEPLVLSVAAVESTSSVGWVSHEGFSVNFGRTVSDLSTNQFTLDNEAGDPIHVSAVQLGSDGKSAVISADLSASQLYSYRIVISDYSYSGTVNVPESIVVHRYTNIEDAGLRVHLSIPVMGLPNEAFHLTQIDGTSAYTLDSVTTVDGGSYLIVPSSYSSTSAVNYKLDIEYQGYDFGEQLQIIRPTLSYWGAKADPAFLTGLAPSVPGLTADNFQVVDKFGASVPIKEVFAEMGTQIVTFEGTRGSSYYVSVIKEGFDFGAPRKITVFANNTIGDKSYNGFTLMLDPPLEIDTTKGFILNRVNGVNVVGAPLGISVATEDNGSSYQIAANLTPGAYRLSVDAQIETNKFYFNIPVVATLSVDQVDQSGIRVSLDYAVNGLNESSFQLTNLDTNSSVGIASVVSNDQGITYRIDSTLPLQGGNYVVRLNGHEPINGVPFQVQDTLSSGMVTLGNITNTGFDLTFDTAVPGLQSVNVDIRNSANNRMSGITLSTSDGGKTYRVNVSLTSGQDYTLSMTKEYVDFGSPVSFHVGYIVTARITQVTDDGWVDFHLSPAMPQLELSGLLVADEEDNKYYSAYVMSAGGAGFRFQINNATPDHTYRIDLNRNIGLDLDDYTLVSPTFKIPSLITVTGATTSGVSIQFGTPVDSLTKSNFVIRGAAGETIAVTSAVTFDSGSNYVLTAALTAGKYYTVQYKSALASQATSTVDFVVQKSITAMILNVTSSSFKVQFSEKVTDIKFSQIILSEPGGTVIGHYSFETKDQGLTYEFRFPVAQTLGSGYTIDFARDEFKLVAPIAFDIPIEAMVSVVHTTGTDLLLHVGSNYGSVPVLSEANFELRDSKGKLVTFSVSNIDSVTYRLTGVFDSLETYTLVTKYTGYDFGVPITFGLRIAVGIDTMFQTQKGFRMFLTQDVPGLTSSEIIVKDDSGNTIITQSIVDMEFGSYQVEVPLSAGNIYTVEMNKTNYVTKYSIPFSLNNRTAYVDKVSNEGFRLNFDSPLLWSSEVSLSVLNEGAEQTEIESIVSWDSGLSYEIGIDLEPDEEYTVVISKIGDDFGSGIPLLIQSIVPSFAGMQPGDSRTFNLVFDQPVPNMRVNEFELRRASDGRRLPLLSADSSDGGTTYKLFAEFLETESYNIVPVKDGYYFGEPIAFSVPIIVRSAVMNAQPKLIEVGLNPSVPSLNASNFALLDSDGGYLDITSAVTEDEGATYRITAPFVGGQSYEVTLSKSEYDFSDELLAEVPSSIVSSIDSVSEAGITIALSPYVSGLSVDDFELKDENGNAVQITDASTANGGITYLLSSALTGGNSYTLTVSLAGYSFGSALTAEVPIPVNVEYADIHADGLTIQLDHAVPGLTNGNITLLSTEGTIVTVAALTSADGGITYSVEADLEENKRYTLSLTKVGYDLGNAVSLFVPIAVEKSVDLLMTTGFTIKLDEAVLGLTASNLTLIDSDGSAVNIVSWIGAVDGNSYEVVAELIGHEVYTLQLTANGYNFGPELQLEALQPLVLSAQNIYSSGFQIDIGDSIPRLNPEFVHLVNSNGVRIGLNGSKFWDTSGALQEGRVYQVLIPIALGEVYTVSIEDPDHPATGPLEVLLPHSINMQIANVKSSGINLTFSQAVTGLQVEDITLLAEDGQSIVIEGIVEGATKTSYSVVASMVESRTYTLAINKKGYDFGASGEAIILVPIRITAGVIHSNESGFSITLSEPVPDLNISLYKDNQTQSISVTTPDEGKTYNVGSSWSSDYPYTLRLNKSGYDLGIDQIIQYEKKKPMLIQAMSNAGGSSVLLTLDMPINNSLSSNSGFSIKINGQWQGGVRATRKDTSIIELTWSGSTLKSTDEIIVAYTGINRVMAANGTYLAQFSEAPVVNVSTTLGMIHSYLAKSDFLTPARKLRDEYNYTALETAELLRDGGFTVSQAKSAITLLYSLTDREALQVIRDMGSDALTAFKALRGMSLPDHPYYWIADLLSVGYEVNDIAVVFWDSGYPIRQIIQSLYSLDIVLMDVAGAMLYAFNESSSRAVAELKPYYNVTDIAGSVQDVYELTDAETVKALFAGGVHAADASLAVQSLYSTDAIVGVELLRGAGYSSKDISGAMSGYSYADVATAVQAFRGAGMNAQEIFVFVIGMYSHTETATAMLIEGMSEIEVTKAVQASGIAGAGAAIHAMRVNGNDIETTARIVLTVYGNSLTLQDTAKEFIQGGFSKETTVSVLRSVFRADVSAAFAALKPHYHSSQYREMLFNVLLDGGYDPVLVAEYYMKQVYSNRSKVLDHFISKDLNSSKLSYAALISQSLKAVHDAVTADGTIYPMVDAVRDLMYGRFLYPQDVLTALRTAYADDVNSEPSVYNVAAGMSEYFTVEQIGVAMREWITLADFIELLRTDALKRWGCSCDAVKIVRYTKFVFGSMEKITIGLSQSGEFTLTEIIAATLPWYPGTTSNEQMTYMTSVLRDTGYPFVEIAGVYEDRGMDWIYVFSRYAIAAKEVASILKSKGRIQAEIIDELRPYPLSDIALVLRELYELDESAAIDALLTANYDQMDIGRAIARAYGGDPVALWVKSLRAQGATADSVLTTITSHYPDYRDASVAGLALVKGGYSTDEVMKALISRSSIPNLQNTIAVLNTLFTQNQVSIAQLLAASSSNTPESGIVFLRNAKYSLFNIIRSLKEYYGVDSGEVAILLGKYYQGNLSVVLDNITNVYGESKEVTAAAALDAHGIVTLAEAIPYLKSAGYGIKDIASIASKHLGTPIGQTADRLTTSYGYGNGKIVIYAVAEVYGQSIESTIYELLAERGISSFAGAIQFTYGQQFDLRTAARLAKNEYGLSAGDTMRELRLMQVYDSDQIVSTVGSVYEMSQIDSIAANLPANNLTGAIPYLVNMEFDLMSIISVGKRYYNLDMQDVSAALTASGLFNGTSETVITALSQVYGQVPSVVVINLLDQLGADSFADAIDILHIEEVSLLEIIRVANSRYELTAGETIQALYESQLYATSDIVSSVAEVYGKPFNESLLGFVEESGLATVEEAVPMLRQFGYTLRDVVIVSKEYYGKSASESTTILSALNFYSLDVVGFTVTSVYGQTAVTNELDVLAQAGITNPQAAATHLWNTGYTLIDITRTLKSSFGRMAGEAASDLLTIVSNDIEGSLYAVNAVYGGTIDTVLINVLKQEVGVSPEAAAESLRKAGYSLRDIVGVMKNNYNQTSLHTSAIMNNLNTYDASVIESIVASIYENSTPAGSMSYILDLYGITTAQGTIQFMKNSNATIKEVAMQLKNRYQLDSVDASELLRAYYQDGEVTLAIVSIYYSDTSLRYLDEFIPSSHASSPYSTAKYMSGKFGLSTIILAMKLLFNLDSLGTMDVMSEVYLNDTAMQTQIYNKIIEVYGNDPVYAKLARMAEEGHSANNLAVVMDSYGKLDLNSNYLVNTLDALGYDDSTILKTRYNYFNLHYNNVGSLEEQAEILLRFGLHTPSAMAIFLRNKTISNSQTMRIIRLALPEASTEDIALGMVAAGGVSTNELNNAMSSMGEYNGEVAGILKQLGYTGNAAADYLDRFFLISDQVRFLESNGYKLTEYLRFTIRYAGFNDELVAALRGYGYTAEAIAVEAYESNAVNDHYRIAEYLLKGGFTDLSVIIDALVKIRLRPLWIPLYLRELDSIPNIAQAMFDTGAISLSIIVNALEYASVSKPEIYRITKIINKDAVEAYLSGMSFEERKALDNYASIIITLGSLEAAGFSAHDSANLLSSEISDFKIAAALLIMSGYEWDTAVGAIWDVYRLAIGMFILEKMMSFFAGNVLGEMKQVWDMVKRMKTIVKVGKMLMYS